MKKALLALAVACFGVLLFKHISYPLLWQDEAETAMFATRILEHGFPKVHGGKNVLYEFGKDSKIGLDERTDSYIGTTWGHFYYGVPGLLWGRTTDDLYERTARMRLPFAVTGFLGLFLFLRSVLPALGPGRGRRELFAALFFLLACFSVSLILHLREARYYALQVFFAAAVLAVYLRHQIYASLSFGRYVAWTTALLVGLFNVFYSAYFSVGLILGLHALYVGWRRGEDPGSRSRATLRGLAPLVLSALVLIPWFIFYETFEIAARFSLSHGISREIYASNLATLLGHLASHELGLAASFARFGAACMRPARRLPWRERDPRRRVAAFLFGFSVGYALFGCLNPLIYERYFQLLAPALILSFLLDASVLLEAVPARFSALLRRRAAWGTGLALAVVVIATGTQRAHDLSQRWIEITERVEGPIDRIVAEINRRFEHPERLIIATNYGAHPLMFYLGSRVIVGYSLNNPRVDLSLRPDVVIPRRTWPRTRDLVWDMIERGKFRGVRLGIEDVPFNNIPSLTKTRFLGATHHFRTPDEDFDPEHELVLHLRRRR